MKHKKYSNFALLIALLLGSLFSPLVSATETTTEMSASTSFSATTQASTSTAQPTTVAENSQAETLEAIEEGIIGDDNQYRIDETTEAPYRQIVHLEMQYPDGSWYVGSGALIGPDLILTAAHNVYHSKTGQWATNVIATPGRNGEFNKPYGVYQASNYAVLSAFQPNGSEQHDTAVIKLHENVDDQVGQLSIAKNAVTGERIQIPGYPFHTPAKQYYMYNMYGSITRIDGKLMRYKLDTEGGQSGSPVLNSQNQIVGVHIVGFRGSSNQYVVNAARIVDEETEKLIEAMRTGVEEEGIASYKALKPKEVTTTSQSTTQTSTTITKPTTKSSTVTKAPTKTKATTTSKPTTKSSTKATVTTKPTTKSSTKPKTSTTTRATTKPSTKLSTKPTTKSSTKPSTKATTKVTTRLTTKATTKRTTKVATKPSTKTTTKRTTKAITKATTKRTTKSTTKPIVKTEPVYRVYHAGIKRHLYTKSLHEVKVLSGRGWTFESEKFRTVPQGTTPVYRLYHGGTREHLYTTGAHERDILKTRGWRYEGVAWYSTGEKPIYRLYHAGLKVHLYTADTNEKNVLSTRSWKYEGVSFYVK